MTYHLSTLGNIRIVLLLCVNYIHQLSSDPDIWIFKKDSLLYLKTNFFSKKKLNKIQIIESRIFTFEFSGLELFCFRTLVILELFTLELFILELFILELFILKLSILELFIYYNFYENIRFWKCWCLNWIVNVNTIWVKTLVDARERESY